MSRYNPFEAKSPGRRRGARRDDRRDNARDEGRPSGERTAYIQRPEAPERPAPEPPPPPRERPAPREFHQPAAREERPPPRPSPPRADADATRIDRDPVPRGGTPVAVLVATQGPLQGRAFCLFEGENLLGRADACRVVFPSEEDGGDGFISRKHAVIDFDALSDAFVIEGKSSRSTQVNGEPIEGREILSAGSTIQMGHTEFKLVKV